MTKRNKFIVVFGLVVVSVLFVSAESLLKGTLLGEATRRDLAIDELGRVGQKEVGRTAVAPCQSRPGMAPEMVLVEAGSFMMGSPKNEAGRDSDEGPQHQVTLQRAYAIGRCEVTVEEYRLFVKETGYKSQGSRDKGCRIWSERKGDWTDDPSADWESPGFTQDGDHPVVCVSWNDAKQYVRWLSLRTNSVYRLPSEVEWEYAARGGTETPYWWGKEIRESGKVWANCNGCGSRWDNKQTAPIGQFPQNPVGIYDTAGNVWEWTEDCWHDSFEGAPEDGLPWGEEKDGDCSRRVVRGGGWNYKPLNLRSANRFRLNTVAALLDLGFRLARDL